MLANCTDEDIASAFNLTTYADQQCYIKKIWTIMLEMYYTQTILYYIGPQQHGTSITNITDCNVIAHYTATLTNFQYSLAVNCFVTFHRNFAVDRRLALFAAANEGSKIKIVVTSSHCERSPVFLFRQSN